MSYDGEYDPNEELRGLRIRYNTRVEEIVELREQLGKLRDENAGLIKAVRDLLAIAGFEIDSTTLKAVRIRPTQAERVNQAFKEFLAAGGSF